MIPDGLVTYSAFQLEDLAEQTLRRRPDVDFAPPINIELLVEHMPNGRLLLREGLRHNCRTEGCVCKEKFSKRVTVIVDWSIYCGPWTHYSAVLAEEFAHITLHPALFNFVQTPEDFVELQSDPQWRRFEADARRFSLSIRLPEPLLIREVETAYTRVVDEHGYGDSDKVETLIRNKIAERFRVSPDDAYRRITNFPCDFRDRIRASVQARELTLLTDSAIVRTARRFSRQQSILFGDINP